MIVFEKPSDDCVAIPINPDFYETGILCRIEEECTFMGIDIKNNCVWVKEANQ